MIGSELLLKPLYSFAGKGIVFDPSDEDLNAIPEAERKDYLLQQRITFHASHRHSRTARPRQKSGCSIAGPKEHQR